MVDGNENTSSIGGQHELHKYVYCNPEAVGIFKNKMKREFGESSVPDLQAHMMLNLKSDMIRSIMLQ